MNMRTPFKNSLIVFAIALLSIPATTCKKYEEGPWISFVSAEKRVSNTWEITEFLINGHDSMEIIGADRRSVQINLDKDDYQNINLHATNSYGHWELIDNKKIFSINIEFHSVEIYSLSIFYGGSYTEWEILRLSKKDFWIKTLYNNMEYLIKMKKKNLTY